MKVSRGTALRGCSGSASEATIRGKFVTAQTPPRHPVSDEPLKGGAMEHTTLWSHETVLAAEAGSAAKARAFVLHQLVEHRLLYLVEDVRMVASELATNALLHALTTFTVILEGRTTSVLLTVRDGMPIGPAFSLEDSQGMPIAGRGLLIVNSLSQSWGVAAQDGKNKSVWASFEMRPRAVS